MAIIKRSGNGGNSMANELFLQLAILSGLIAILICLLILKRRQAKADPPRAVPIARAEVQKKSETLRPVQVDPADPAPRTVTVETNTAMAETAEPVKTSSAAAAVKPTVVHAQPVANQEDRNQQILAGISANIRNSVIKPVPTYSPID